MAGALLQSYLGPLARSIRVQEEGKGTRVRTYVDDITLAKTGTEQEVAEALVRAYGMAKEGLGQIGQKLQITRNRHPSGRPGSKNGRQ
eukprot:4608983-Heterocapsa_arctica.AAC.1